MNVGNVNRSNVNDKPKNNNNNIIQHKNYHFKSRIESYCQFHLQESLRTSSKSTNDYLRLNPSTTNTTASTSTTTNHHSNCSDNNNNGASAARTGSVGATTAATAASSASAQTTTTTSPAANTLNNFNCGVGVGVDVFIAPFIYYMLIVIFMLCIYLCLDQQTSRVYAFEQFVAKFNNNSWTSTTSNTNSSNTMIKSTNNTAIMMMVINKDDKENANFPRLNRKSRSTASVSKTFGGNNINDQPFTILALLPDEKAPFISRALRDGQSKWEMSGHLSEYLDDFRKNQSINYNNNNKMVQQLRASDIQLTIYSEPTNNDTERILSSTCEWIKVHKPSLVLSLLDHQRSFYAAMVSESANVPFVSMTQHYQNEINDPSIDDYYTANNDNNNVASDKSKRNRYNNYWMPSPNRLSLDPPIQTLADATFKLLRAQYWFDALLIIDESIVSDLFARRLSSLCDSFRRKYGNRNNRDDSHYYSSSASSSSFVHGANNAGIRYKRHNYNGQKQSSTTTTTVTSKNNNKIQLDPTTMTKTSSDTQYDTFTWMELKRSSVKKSTLLADTLLLPQQYKQKFQTEQNSGKQQQQQQEPFGGQSIFEQQQRQTHPNQQQQFYSKDGLLISIWKSLMIIRISQSLDQKEFYLRMAEIQNTHRRVVLVHCDKSTIERVLKTGRELDLFNGEKIWILLDGLLGPDEKFDQSSVVMDHQNHDTKTNNNVDGTKSSQSSSTTKTTDSLEYHLPNGILAIQNRHRLIYDPDLLDSIVELMGKAALNSYQKRLIQQQFPEQSWPTTTKKRRRRPKSSPFFDRSKILENNYYSNFQQKTLRSAFSSSNNNNTNSNNKDAENNSTTATKITPSKQFMDSNIDPVVASASVSYSSSSSLSVSSSLPIKSFNKFQSTSASFSSNSNNNNQPESDSNSNSGSGCLTSIPDDSLLLDYTKRKQIEYRLDILDELRKLLNPILARYRRSRSRCSQKQHQQQQWSMNKKKNPIITATTLTTSKSSTSSTSSSMYRLYNSNRNRKQQQDYRRQRKTKIFANSVSGWHPASSLLSMENLPMNNNNNNDNDDQAAVASIEIVPDIASRKNENTNYNNNNNNNIQDTMMPSNGPVVANNDAKDYSSNHSPSSSSPLEEQQHQAELENKNPEQRQQRRHVYNAGDVDDDEDHYPNYDYYNMDFMADSVDQTNNNKNDEDDLDDDDYDDHDDIDDDADVDDLFQQEMYRSIVPQFDILNLVPILDSNINNQKGDGMEDIQKLKREWRLVGNITYDQTIVNTIMYIGADQWPNYLIYAASGQQSFDVGGGDSITDSQDPNKDSILETDSIQLPPALPRLPIMMTPTTSMIGGGKHRFRVVTNIAPPFVIESTKLDNNTCLIGVFCLKVLTNVRDDLIAIFTDFRSQRRQMEGKTYNVHCCAGIAIDLLNAVGRDLHFDYDLYLVADGLFGIKKDGKWDGVTADLVNDVAHLSFTAFSTTSSRVQAIDYSVPFFYSGVSCLSSVSSYSDVRLLAFLIPFSYELWAAIFASLVATAIAAAIYEWFSPFGLNPWGRQRTKNFSLASALWVMCSLLFSHLVAFKAPKSWPNKVLINVWGAFSVIFLATYTANIAAHFAGFLLPEVNDFHDSSLMQQRTGTARSSASEGYLMEKYTELWHHIQRYKVDSFDAGLENLRNGKLDVLIGDTAILDYYRANDPGCNLRLLGDSIFDDAYAIGMQKGFPFRESISNLILKYNEYGFLDQLHRKWYGRVHCLESTSLSKPEPLTVRGVAGVFLMLTIGILIGILILLAEHFTFKYWLPGLRKKPKDCFWKSPNLMFFSQKLYRFINTVELVSPHHSAKEIITNLREGQIASLFQKSVKRKAKEEARRRKSKSQFFEMIQEVRKVVHLQQTERSMQQDDDEMDVNVDDEEYESDIDEEVALNTNANIRATRPSFSMSQDELLEMEIQQNRVSAIRFREPNETNNQNEVNVHHYPPNPSELIHRKLASSLKSSTESSLASIPKKYNSSTDSQDNTVPMPGDDRERNRRHRKKSGQQYLQNMTTANKQKLPKPIETARTRRKKLLQAHLSSTSFSLENIFFQGLLSEGLSDQDEKKRHRIKRRTLSFEDLPAIKKELSESSQEDYGGNLCESEQYHRYTPKTPTTMAPLTKSRSSEERPRRSKSKLIRHQATSVTESPTSRYTKLSKQDILNRWKSSERQLETQLQVTMQQKRELEEKVALLERMLKKPP